MDTTATQTLKSASIVLTRPDGRQETHVVSQDNNLIVGSSASCSIRIEDSSVSSMHCLIQINGGRLSVQDWYTTGGTFLNGRKLECPSDFGPGDELRVGECLMTVELADGSPEPAQESAAQPAAAQQFDAEAETSDSDEDDSAELDDAAEEQLEAIRALRDELAGGGQKTQERIHELEIENETLREQLAYIESSSSDGIADPFDREMLEMLKEEVEHLQNELAQRDAQIVELQVTGPIAEESTDEENDSPDTAMLVDRLERLLNELQSSDERIAALEDLLRVADEATRAEQDERRQLSTWVSEIEERIAQREEDWQAQQDVLQKRLDELNEEKNRFDERLRDLMRQQGTTAQAQVNAELRAEIERLKDQLQQTEETRDALRKQIDTTEFQQTTEGLQKHIDELLREERLKIAEANSQIARERAEVARLKAEFEIRAPVQERQIDDATCRVQALRQHLNDIHRNEKQGGAESAEPPAGISGRLANLWKRLENW